ncbi:MAG: hypothetical protein DRJ98_06985 [Thermoprotei archaeon]|nr:MAG: hypothetical protein DRJ98_06985 [Thermoprotei archaeon]RLF18168.1 MAG: hypothetical protein DRN06_02140 [Thermoprotei archaeon]
MAWQLSLNNTNGRLTLRDVEEAVATEMLTALKESIINLFGPSVAAIIMFKLGEVVGVRECKKMDITTVSARNLKILFSNVTYGRMNIAIYNDYNCEGRIHVKNLIDRGEQPPVNGDGGGVGCYFYKGLIKGATSALFKSDVVVHEVRCGLKRNSYCEYYFCKR